MTHPYFQTHAPLATKYEWQIAREIRTHRMRELKAPGPNPQGAGRPASDKYPVLALFRPGVRLSITDVAKTLALPRHAARDALSILSRAGAIYVCAKGGYGANIYAAPDHRSDDAKILHALRDGKERLANEIAPLVGKTPCEVSKVMVRLTAAGSVVTQRMAGTFAYLHGYKLA